MKFLPDEHLSIMNLLQGRGYGKEEIFFRKKKGQLHVELNDRQETFCYYRKTETRLNSNLKFEDKTLYYLGPKKDHIVEDWTAVLNALEAWLGSL